LPAGSFQAEWLNTETGAIDKRESFTHNGGIRTLVSPEFQYDIALRVLATGRQATKKGRPAPSRQNTLRPLKTP
jgi:hypothetical protein